MNDEPLVRIADGGADALKQGQPVGNGQIARITVLVNRLALDVFHNEVGQAVISCSTVQQTGNVRMIKHRQYLSFTLEPLNDVVRIQFTPDDFDSNQLVKRLVGASRQIDIAHASAANLPQDAVDSDPMPFRESSILPLQKSHRIP